MSQSINLSVLRGKLASLQNERDALAAFRKSASFIPSPAMPQGPPPMPPPVDPATGQPMPQGPPVDPATGQPMMAPPPGPPIDPATGQPMGGAPVDPTTGQPMMQGPPPMDPSAGQPAPQGGSPVTPEAMDQIIGLLEEMGQQIAALQKSSQTQAAQFEKAVGELTDHVEDLDQRLAKALTPGAR